MSTLFTKIIEGELPSYKVFENEYVFAFLALDQIELGHTLIVPKVEVDHFSHVPEPYYSEVFKAAKILSEAIQKASGCLRVGAIFAGFEVPHCHYHLVPLNSESDLSFSKARPRSKNEMLEIQEKILSYLNS